MSERYVTVTCELVKVLPRSFLVENKEGTVVAIGRSCVHGVDEKEIADRAPGDEVEFRVMEWLAEKEGLA